MGNCTRYLLERSAGLWNQGSPVENVEGVALDVGFGAFAVVGALLVVKRPGNLIGWIMAAIALMLAIFPAAGTYATYVMVTRGQPDTLAVFGAWMFNWFWFLFLALALVYLPMLFPDGRLLSRRWLPIAVLAGIGPLSIVLLNALVDTLPVNEAAGYRIDNPIGIEGLGNIESLPVYGALSGLFFVGFAGVVASVVVRFRRSREAERQQMKWFASATVYATGVRWLEEAGFVLSLVGIASLPIAVGIAILRHRLYDIDLIINRTLVYGALTASLVLVYLGGVISLQYVFRALTGQESTLAVVASTLAIAALFNPLRRHIQAFIDRIFYRKKYDAAKTLEAFSARLRNETDLGELSGDLIKVVQETLQPARVSLWLRSPTEVGRGGELSR